MPLGKVPRPWGRGTFFGAVGGQTLPNRAGGFLPTQSVAANKMSLYNRGKYIIIGQ